MRWRSNIERSHKQSLILSISLPRVEHPSGHRPCHLPTVMLACLQLLLIATVVTANENLRRDHRSDTERKNRDESTQLWFQAVVNPSQKQPNTDNIVLASTSFLPQNSNLPTQSNMSNNAAMINVMTTNLIPFCNAFSIKAPSAGSS